MKRLCVLLGATVLTTACGSTSSTPAAPSPQLSSLGGTVRNQAGVTMAGARIEIVDGLNQGKATNTNAYGVYLLGDLQAGSFTLRATLSGYITQSVSVTLTGNQTLDVELRKLLRADLVTQTTNTLRWKDCTANSCGYIAEGFNRGDGCATQVRGVIRVYNESNGVIATDEWNMPVTDMVRPGSIFTYEGCCLVRAEMDKAKTLSYNSAFAWDDVECK